ncbi:MAG: HAD family hydrolase [Phycisphaerae bacterium]|nr:HAD family hydrolase [Phycisphaerae bacterium]
MNTAPQAHTRPTRSPAETRSEIDSFLAAGKHAEARAAIEALWRADPTPATASFMSTRAEQLRGHVPLATCRLFIMRSFTVEPALPLLRAQCFCGGIDLIAQPGEFNTYVQEILDPRSPLYAFKPDAAILAVQSRDVAPDLWKRFPDLTAEEAESIVSGTASAFESWIDSFRKNSTAHLIVHLLELPDPAQGILDVQQESGQADAIRRINDRIRAACRAKRNVYVLDVNDLIARRGREQWGDERMWLTARLPVAPRELIHLARAWARYLHPITGRVCKALVCDLDNTLWGGVIGEDGMTGIRLSAEHPGAYFQELQRAILDLSQRGVILAIASKNNLDDAMEAIKSHPGMLLRPDHFAALRINWQDKATNLREIARELNIGIDSLAFIDDNPVERTWVREQVPEVTVIDLPADPSGFARALRDSPVFERLTLTAEDKERGRQYAENRVRSELQQQAGSIEEFYASLQQEVEIAHVTPMTLARVAQLTNKTNQFNLTTRRYTEQQVQEMSDSADCRVYSIKVKDRFGDNGLVGVAIARFTGSVCEIDSFLLSCRVIGRTVETSFLAAIIEEARARGCTLLRSWFIPTKKNAPAKDFLASQGFTKVKEDAETQTWEFDLANGNIAFPAWIRRL